MTNIIIYGAAGFGSLTSISLDDEQYRVIAFVDIMAYEHNFSVNGVEVISPLEISNYDYDFVLISNQRNSTDIITQLLELGVPKEKILEYVHAGYANLDTRITFQDSRMSTLRLCCDNLKERNVQGALAEVGVYKGEFSKYLNKYFPDRKLFLFDTFQGMDECEEVRLVTNGKSFMDTSVNTVLSKMVNKDNVIIKKGYFPATAIDIDETFALVSLDTDLYDSILAGLEFFWPRMSPGGYIFVHDFGVYTWGGVRKAVIEFCDIYSINYVPISDVCGSVVLVK